MAYTPQTWSNSPSSTTPINATRLNYMESGIASASVEASRQNIKKDLGAVSGNVTCNLAEASVFTATIADNTSFSFINWPANAITEPLIVAKQGSVGGKNFEVAGVTWLPEGVSPEWDLKPYAINFASVVSVDSGTTIFGATHKNYPLSPIVGTTDEQTLINKTLTAPVVSEIRDVNNKIILTLKPTADATTSLQLYNGLDSGPGFKCEGTPANINMAFQPKGNGGFIMYVNTSPYADISAGGTAATIDMRLWSKGTGSKVLLNNDEAVTRTATQVVTNKDLRSGTNQFPTSLVIGTSGGAQVITRNTVVAIGASTTAWGVEPYGYTAANNWFTQLCIASKQRMQLAGIFATAGYRLDQVQSTHLPSVLAMNPTPGACIIFCGANDHTQGTSFTAMQATLKSMCNSLLAAGIVPIIATLPPRSDNATWAQRTVRWNTWLTRFSALKGFPVIDGYTPLVDSNGGMVVSNNNDGLHPTEAGHRLIALNAIADGVPDWFPPNHAPRTSKSSADMTNLFNSGTVTHGLNLLDTNTDGLCNGWSVSGSGTITKAVFDPDDDEDLMGRWQEISRTSSNGDGGFSSGPLPGWSVGDTLAFSARIKTTGINTTKAPWNFRIKMTGSSTTYRGITNAQSDMEGLIYCEFTVPSGVVTVSIEAILSSVVNAGIAKIRVGEVTLRNLTVDQSLL